MIRFNKPTIEKKDLESVLYCMIGDDLTPGEHLKEFQSLLGKFIGLSQTIVFNNYLQPFDTIFRLIDANSGDEVIMPSFARYRLYHAVIKQGLKPVLVDLEDNSFLPSLDQMRVSITEHTRCMVIPQMFGIPHDISLYTDLSVPVIEDLDGSLGSTINGKPIGSFGTFVTMSFNDDSIITAGNGGMVASKDKRLRSIVRSLKGDESSFDYLLSDFNASLGISQMRLLEKNREKRKQIGEYYDRAVMCSNCSLVGRDDEQELSYSSYVVKTETPVEDCMHFFKRYGIPIKRGISKPLHHYMNLDIRKFRRTEELYHKIIALPIYPTLQREHIENIAKGIRTIL